MKKVSGLAVALLLGGAGGAGGSMTGVNTGGGAGGGAGIFTVNP